ncbi:uncharacterized protein LOC129887552 isoform X2 [Solanum dulcamara]|uniref:uncharacterized protein LOC129887552 isoform X2 n=1 Tax=Solanum dulcamara TaxID=45834 RepID=UPI00248587AE|nr:uncharacterized protein LOC129887552 isoform X2 [Solanum dulcamara]
MKMDIHSLNIEKILVFKVSHSSSRVAILNMSGDSTAVRPLFGDTISTTFPLHFQDVTNMRQVPNHQVDVVDSGSAIWFLQDLANEQEAEETTSAVFEAPGLCYRNMPVVITTTIDQMAVSKGRQGREAQNLVKVYLANIRLKEVGADVLITAYEPLVINPLSESDTAVGVGMAVPSAQSGVMPMAEVFKLAVSSFEVHNWSLFGSGAAV